MDPETSLKYGVGALLYCPALNARLSSVIKEGRIAPPYSVCICLEDSIADSAVEEAEEQTIRTLEKISALSENTKIYIPKIFIRVRYPSQTEKLFGMAGKLSETVTGVVFPKYSASNAADYNEGLRRVNSSLDKKLYMMPIIESRDVLDILTRRDALFGIREYVREMGDRVLNIRIGGNDFCNKYGLRRKVSQSIYDIAVIKSVISDIVNVFSEEYVVSAPVWEYFGDRGGDWEKGLENELELDRLNGLFGKTSIHPCQVPVINESLKVSLEDKLDAESILSWGNERFAVGKSSGGTRMNEVKCHGKWAEKIMIRAELYGVREPKINTLHGGRNYGFPGTGSEGLSFNQHSV